MLLGISTINGIKLKYQMDDVRIRSRKRLGIYGQTAADVWISMSEKSRRLMNISVSDAARCLVFGGKR